MKLSKYCFIAFFTFCITVNSYSQSNKTISEILLNANNLYEQGQFSEALKLVNSCSFTEASTSNKWKAQRLLAIIYLAEDKPELAREAAANMLELNPTYKPSHLNDPAPLIKLIHSIRVIPKLSLGLALSIGTNATFPVVTKQYVLADYNKTYFSQNSFQFGASIGYNFNSRVAVGTGVYSSQNKFKLSYQFPDWEVSVSEKLTYLNIPLSLNYTFLPNSKWRCYLQGGVSGGKLLNSAANFSSTYIPLNQNSELQNLSTESRRNKYQFGIIGGIGMRYEAGQGNVFIQANYCHSLSNITNTETRYKYAELTNTYYYIDDDIILHSIAVNIGYAFYMNYKVIRK